MRKALTSASRPKGRLARTAVALSARLNYERALRWPGQAPYLVLTEFPRSGGNWMRDMLGDALQLPVPRFGRFPVTFPAIIHNHDHRVLTTHPSIYVLRDGRDVFMSHFDKTVTTYLAGSAPLKARLLKLHPSLQPLNSGAERSQIDMTMFYREWKTRPMGSRVNWGDHIHPWLTQKPANTTFIRYEDMRANPNDTLAAAVQTITDEPIPDATIAFAVARNSFEAQTGRKAGELDVTSTKRMGLAGAWKSQMPQDIQDLFKADFGATLTAAGYAL